MKEMKDDTKKAQSKKTLVTGVGGFNGLYMAELLVKNGYAVRGTDLPDADRKSFAHLDIEFIPADLTKPETLDEVTKGIDIVFHPASIFDYLPSLEKMRRVNVEGTRNLLDAMKKNGVLRIIHWSTVDVYGDPMPEHTPITEDHPKNPKNAYQISKWEQEKLVVDYCTKEKIDYTVLRPAPVYGPRSRYGIVSMPLLIGKGNVLFYLGGDSLHIPIVNVNDVCRAALFLAEHPASVGEVYHLADETWYDHRRFFLYIAALFNQDENMVRLPAIPKPILRLVLGMLYNYWKKRAEREFPKRLLFDADEIFFGFNDYRFDNSKIKKLGFVHKYPDFTVGMAETVEWLKKNNMV